MQDDDVTTPETEGDEPEDQEVTTEADDLETNDEADGDEEGEGDEQDAEADEEEWAEVERDGKKYKLPKWANDERLMHADYTRKTQEVAEQRRAIEESQKVVQEQAQFQQQFLKEFAQIEAVNDRLAEYDKIDWQQLNAQHPQKAQELWIQRTQLIERRATLAQAVQQKKQTLDTQRADERAKQIEKGQTLLRKHIPNLTPELDSKLTAFATAGLPEELRYSSEEVSAVTDPRAVYLLNLAYTGFQLAEKQRKAMQKKPQPEANPVSSVKTRGKPDNRLRDDISTDEWVKRRNAQLAARNR